MFFAIVTQTLNRARNSRSRRTGPNESTQTERFSAAPRGAACASQCLALCHVRPFLAGHPVDHNETNKWPGLADRGRDAPAFLSLTGGAARTKRNTNAEHRGRMSIRTGHLLSRGPQRCPLGLLALTAVYTRTTSDFQGIFRRCYCAPFNGEQFIVSRNVNRG